MTKEVRQAILEDVLNGFQPELLTFIKRSAMETAKAMHAQYANKQALLDSAVHAEDQHIYRLYAARQEGTAVPYTDYEKLARAHYYTKYVKALAYITK